MLIERYPNASAARIGVSDADALRRFHAQMRFLVAAAQLSSCTSLAFPKEFSPHNIRWSLSLPIIRHRENKLHNELREDCAFRRLRCRVLPEIIWAKSREIPFLRIFEEMKKINFCANVEERKMKEREKESGAGNKSRGARFDLNILMAPRI